MGRMASMLPRMDPLFALFTSFAFTCYSLIVCLLGVHVLCLDDEDELAREN